MGGRGASSGFSTDKNGNPKNEYGSQYHTLLEHENIKFVTKNTRNSETLMETMTPGRVYAEVGGNDLLRIVFFDENNKVFLWDISSLHFPDIFNESLSFEAIFINSLS